MRHHVLLSILMSLLAALNATAQKLAVESFGVAQDDLSASVYPRNDRNGEPCGLIKVQMPLQGVHFQGNVMGDVDILDGEYWVYMSRGAYQLSIQHPQFHRLDLNLRELMPAEAGFRGVEPKVTYNLVIKVPQQVFVEIDDGMRYLVLKVIPATASVDIDGTPRMLQPDGTAMMRLSQGSHTYLVRAPGYAEQQGTIDIGQGKASKTITLESIMTQLTVSCPTPGAQIYVNDQLRGASPWSGQLSAGNYLFEARRENYYTGKTSLTLAERDNRQITLPALTPITGTLDVSYQPLNAEVWIDGSKAGTSPDIFRKLIIGEHHVELRADGYDTKQETVTIREGQTTQLSGQLERTQTASNTPASTSSLSNSTVQPFTVTGNGKTVTFTMLLVKAGTFQMGSKIGESDEQPVHSVTLTKDYYMGETEVTQELWYAVMGQKPTPDKDYRWVSAYGLGDNYPAYRISYEDCQQFIAKLNQMTGQQFRFPTEAEWEFAARGGNKSKGYPYAGSKTIDDVAWYHTNSNSSTHKVKTKKPNELGLYDMSGNVWEWCYDWYGSYPSATQTDPTGPDSGSERVNRGGSWSYSDWSCRAANRLSSTPSGRYDTLGFRLAL